MHILHVNLAKGFRGGERQTQLLIDALQQPDIQQTLVCRPDSPLRTSITTQNITFIDAAHWIQGAIQKISADILHAHETKGAYWSALQHWRTGTPYLITRRVDHTLKNTRKHRWLYGNAAMLVGLSRVIAAQLQLFNAHVQIIPDAHQVLTATPPSTEIIRHARERWIVGHIGVLNDANKGQQLLLTVARQHPEWFFVFVGDGDDRDYLQAQAGNNVYWAGQVSDVLPYLATFDVFAFPSRYEGLGSSILDAMALGKLIVATHVGGIPDIIQSEKNGVLVPPNDAIALEQALVQLNQDVTLSTQLKHTALRDAERYTAQAMAIQYQKLYKAMIT